MKGCRVFCFDYPEKVTAVVFGHPVNHAWKRAVSQARYVLGTGTCHREGYRFHDIGFKKGNNFHNFGIRTGTDF